jgi:hypothetical protein
LKPSRSRQGGGDPDEIGFAGHPENPSDPVNEKAGRKRAKNQIFHAGFERGGIASREADQDVKGNRHQLQRDEDHDEVDGGGHPHQAGTGKDRQREKFAETGLVRRAMDGFPDDRRVIDHHDQNEDRGDEREAFEKNRERIGGVKTPETRGGNLVW